MLVGTPLPVNLSEFRALGPLLWIRYALPTPPRSRASGPEQPRIEMEWRRVDYLDEGAVGVPGIQEHAQLGWHDGRRDDEDCGGGSDKPRIPLAPRCG